MKRFAPALLLLATPVAAQDTSYRSGDRMYGTLVTSPQGQAVLPGLINRGGANVATAQIAVATTATLVAPARPARQRVLLSVGGATACAFGNATVTSTTGFPLQPVAGAALTIDTSAAIYAVCAASTTISVLEQY